VYLSDSPIDDAAGHHKSQDRSNREVDAADDDDQGHPNGQDPENRDLVEYVQGIAYGEKDIGGERENYAQKDQAEERSLDADHPVGPGSSFRCGDRGRRINDGVLGIAHCSGKRF